MKKVVSWLAVCAVAAAQALVLFLIIASVNPNNCVGLAASRQAQSMLTVLDVRCTYVYNSLSSLVSNVFRQDPNTILGWMVVAFFGLVLSAIVLPRRYVTWYHRFRMEAIRASHEYELLVAEHRECVAESDVRLAAINRHAARKEARAKRREHKLDRKERLKDAECNDQVLRIRCDTDHLKAMHEFETALEKLRRDARLHRAEQFELYARANLTGAQQRLGLPADTADGRQDQSDTPEAPDDEEVSENLADSRDEWDGPREPNALVCCPVCDADLRLEEGELYAEDEDEEGEDEGGDEQDDPGYWACDCQNCETRTACMTCSSCLTDPNVYREFHAEAKRQMLARGNATVNPPDIEALKAEWYQFWLEHGITCDFTTLSIPRHRPGFDRLLIIPQGVSAQALFQMCNERFPCRKYTDGHLAVDSVSDQMHGAYAIWVRNGVDADEEHRNKSADNIKQAGINGITLEERLVLELKYWAETGAHLDCFSVTLCTGSRYTDGRVPCVCIRGSGVDVDRYSVDDHHDRLSVREAVS